MIKKITQSFMKSVLAYQAGQECGNILKAQWVDDRLLELDSDAMALGCYFEYILTGALPKNGLVPKPDMMANGKDMMAPYRLVHKNTERIRTYFEKMGLKIVSFGKKLTKGRFEGTIDIIAECTLAMKFDSGVEWKEGDKIVIDTKYSSLIEDRWSEHGWKWSDTQKQYHGTQAKHYHNITGLPFYFLVCSSKNDQDVKLFHVPVDEHMIEHHIRLGNSLFADFEKYVAVGLVARPEIAKCMKCPLKNECTDKHEFPHVEVVDLTIGV